MRLKSTPRILVAPGPYKECLDSFRVAKAMELGIRDILPEAEISLRPLCDGGSGIARVLAEVTGGVLKSATVLNPFGRTIDTHFAMLGDGKTAVIESASAIGLALISKHERDPLRATSYGVGQLMCAAIDSGAFPSRSASSERRRNADARIFGAEDRVSVSR